LPLVAFIQHSELHKDIGAYFSQTLRPPLVSVGVVEANEQLLIRLFSPRKPFVPPSNPPEGILKADWFLKQRQRRPAVALALISRDELEGDPIAWQRVLGQLRVIKDAASQRGAGVLVLVIHNGPINSELPADRIAGICHNLALDPTAFCSISRDWLGSADGRWAFAGSGLLLPPLLHLPWCIQQPLQVCHVLGGACLAFWCRTGRWCLGHMHTGYEHAHPAQAPAQAPGPPHAALTPL
jgi:hypothetical protein